MTSQGSYLYENQKMKNQFFGPHFGWEAPILFPPFILMFFLGSVGNPLPFSFTPPSSAENCLNNHKKLFFVFGSVYKTTDSGQVLWCRSRIAVDNWVMQIRVLLRDEVESVIFSYHQSKLSKNRIFRCGWTSSSNSLKQLFIWHFTFLNLEYNLVLFIYIVFYQTELAYSGDFYVQLQVAY